MSESVRIQKYLANLGLASRRTIESWIEKGRIKVDGELLTNQGLKIDPNKPPKILLDNKPLKLAPKTRSKLYALHKPLEVLTTLKDQYGRKTIKSFLPKGKRLYPIGRLDYNSSGLLIITDDGDLTNRLLHPSFKVEKEYIVKIQGSTLSKYEKEVFRQGIELDDGPTAPCKLIQGRNPRTYTVILKEGKKRQIRRMFKALGREIESLHRIRFGPIKLGNLKAGEIKQLSPKERAELYKAVKLPVT